MELCITLIVTILMMLLFLLCCFFLALGPIIIISFFINVYEILSKSSKEYNGKITSTQRFQEESQAFQKLFEDEPETEDVILEYPDYIPEHIDRMYNTPLSPMDGRNVPTQITSKNS